MRRFGKAERMRRRTSLVWLLAAAQLAVAQFVAAPAAALQVIEATDHAELTAEVSSSEVSRIALEGDRIARVVQSGGVYTLEHDPVRGDLYLYPGAAGAAAGLGAPSLRAQAPLTLYLGTEKGLTYRLTLTPVARDSAQILIRNRTVSGADPVVSVASGSGRESAVVALIGAVARREPRPGYTVVAANVAETGGTGAEPAPNGGEWTGGIRQIETWRGPWLTAQVLQVPHDGPRDASELAAWHGPGTVAAWLSGAAHGGAAHGGPAQGSPADASPSVGSMRLAVIVEPAGLAEHNP